MLTQMLHLFSNMLLLGTFTARTRSNKKTRVYINIEQMTEIRVTIAKRISFTENYNEIFSMTRYAFPWLIFLLDTNYSHNPWREDKTMTNFLISDGKGKIPSVKSL